MTGLILAIDVTTPHGSLALADSNGLLEEFPLEAPHGYGELLFAAIDGLLKRHGTAVEEIALFAAASGPGTFTGVRIGIAAVQGFGEALGRPVCGVSNLQAIAALGEGPLRAVAIDARRGEFYTALYDSELNPVLPERLQTLEAFRAYLPIVTAVTIGQPGPLAAAIAAIARVHLAAGLVTPPDALDANYIRRSDAELNLNVRPPSPPRT